LNNALASDLEARYPGRDTRALSRDFLELRGLEQRIDDSSEATELIRNRTEAIRLAASRLFEGTAQPQVPGPVLDAEQEGLLELLTEKVRSKIFDTFIEGAHLPPISIISCGGQPATRSLVSLPYAGFLRATASYRSEVRALLISPDADLRQGAAWALWLRFQEADALRIFLEDSRHPDLMTRARALRVLATIRNVEAAPLFPPLLRNSSPELRQVGLWGVQALEVRSAIPELEKLIFDDNAAVAETAIEVLGSLKPPGARPLLMRLLSGSERLAWKASMVLPAFRSAADIDAFVNRLADLRASENERWLILGVLTRITAHPGLQIGEADSLYRRTPLASETIREWRNWWRGHRRESAAERFRTSVADLVELFVKGDTRESTMAALTLSRLVPALMSVTTSHPPTPRERDAIQRWWRDARGGDPWSLLASGGVVPDSGLDLAMDIDPQRTRLQLVASLREYPSASESYHPNPSHGWLAQFAGVDFGDPAVALCDTREKIVADWLAWAKKEDWIQ
ncbi:MAG TPA: HEAT repeat domain-containing protein, partial [Gemmatimonadales bacterium]|nr:HEAT repeat domain-containing protein [Gemmatimonadales bacterium]